MDFPPYQDPWFTRARPRNEKSFKGIPVQFVPKASPSPVQSSKPKMVSIPVQFVGSERGRSDSAIKIQKVFRGFLVRKNVKKIMAIMEQVNDIGRSVSKSETVDLIRSDSKERLRVNEILMSLLFKLDSVRGVDPSVKDLRKSVIKKAIALQEAVDAIVSGDQSVDSDNDDVVDQSQGIIDTCIESENQVETTTNACNQIVRPENHEETTNDAERVPNSSEESEGTVAINHENEVEAEVEKETGEADNEKERMLGRIMEDNERMMKMMETLFERNEMQTRLLSELTQRVDQVEKAFLCDKLRRKKKTLGGKKRSKIA